MLANSAANAIFGRFVACSKLRFFLSLFLPLSLIYGATASWQLPQDFDALTNAVTAWHIGKSGSPMLPGYEYLTTAPYVTFMGSFMNAPGGTTSVAPPGAALLAAPLYAFTPGELQMFALLYVFTPAELQVFEIYNQEKLDFGAVGIPLPPLWPATFVAVFATAAAMSILGLAFLQQGAPNEAWAAAWIAALGTSAWSVASDALFMHGPAMLWIALGVYLSSQQRYWTAGLSLGAAVLSRPHTAVIPAALGIGISAFTRNLRPIAHIGLASSLGVLALVAYNFVAFDKASILAGYSGAFARRLVAPDPFFFFNNLFGGLFAPSQGFLVLSPFLLLLVPGLCPAWRHSAPWVRSAAVGGLVYLLLQFKMNRYDPANSTLYRYPLEALTASAPLWFAAYLYWLKGAGGIWRRLLPKAVVLAIGIQIAAILLI